MLRLPPLRALAYRNFRLYFFGQGISVLGTWMQQVAVGWMVFCLTGSPLWLGLVGFAGQIPALFISPFAGAMVDRVNRHRLVMFTQALAMLLALTLAALTLTGQITVGQLVALSLLSGIVDAFDIPARQFLLTEMVGQGEDLANAIALNSSIFNAARLIGPALAGFLLVWTNAGVCFLINGLSYVAVLVALLAIRLPVSRCARASGRFLEGIGEGFAYAWGFGPIRAVLLLTGLVGMAATASTTLLPMVAQAMPNGGASTLGLLTAATGAGGAGGHGFVGGPKERGWTGEVDCRCAGCVRPGFGRFLPGRFAVRLRTAHGRGRLRVIAGHGGEQYVSANNRGREQTRRA